MDVTYNFTAGTRAVAQQVNQNFSDVKSAVDPLQTAVTDIQEQLTSGIILPDGSVDFTRLQSYKTYTVSNATNATPIVITAVGHSFLTGDKVYISDVGGNTAANGIFTITKKSADTFELDGSVGNGAFTSNGMAIIYPSANNNLSNKAYVDNGDLKTIVQIGTCSTASYDITLTGTVTATSGSTTITGTSTLFTTECPVGSTIVVNGTPYYVSTVSSNTNLTISQPYNNTTGTYTAYKANNAKIVFLPNFILTSGATVQVLFTNLNYGQVPTLNINSTGAKAIYNEAGTAVSATNPAYFPAGSTIEFTYNGTNWIFKNRVVKTLQNQSDSYNSYIYKQFSDGRAQLWGFTEYGNITFPIAFLYAPYINITCTTGFYGSFTNPNFLCVQSISNTGFSKAGDTTNFRYFWYFAEGY